uniref:Dystrophin n=1 Tax=Romanomermis culicivorax TaxID=13658 RepID=A0A915HIZ8_ROMCU
MNGKCLTHRSSYFRAKDRLPTIKEHIDVVESNIEKLQQQKDAILTAPQDLIEGLESDPKKIEFAMSSLKDQLTRLNDVYNERVRLYELTLDNWQAFHKNLNSVISYLDQIDGHLSKDDSENSDILQKELEKGFYQKEAELKLINNVSDELLKTTNEYDSNLLKEKVDYLNRRFHSTAAHIADRLEKIEKKQDRTSELRDDIDELLFWLDESEALLTTAIDPTDHEALSDMTDRLNEKTNEFEDKDKKVGSIEQLANNFVKAARVPDHIKDGVLTDVRELKSRLKKLEDDLRGKLIDEQTRLRQCGQFWTKFRNLASWIESTRTKLQQYNSAIIHSPLRFDCSSIEAEINAKQIEMDDLRLCFQHLENQADEEEIQVSDRNRRCLLNLTNDYSQVLNLFILLKSSSSSSSDTDSKITTSEDAAGDRLENMAESELHSSLYSSIQKDRNKAVSKKSKVSNTDDNVTDNLEEIQQEASESNKINILDQKNKLAEEDALKNLVQLRHWMNDGKREISGSIDISNHVLIKDCLKKQQVFADNLQNKKLQLIKIMDSAETSDIQHKGQGAAVAMKNFDLCIYMLPNVYRYFRSILDSRIVPVKSMDVPMNIIRKSCGRSPNRSRVHGSSDEILFNTNF